MPLSVKRELERVAASFSPEVAASLATEASAAPRQVAAWRVRVATVSAWTSGLGAVAAGIVFTIITDSGVESDQTDPRLWGAMVVCSGLAATAFLTLLDPPVSRGRLGVGVAGVAGLIAILLAWGFLTGNGDLQVGTGNGDLQVGQCYSGDQLNVVPCSQRHDGEVFAIVPLPGKDLPSEAELERLSDQACAAQFHAYVGEASQDPDLYFLGLPNGDGTMACTLETLDSSGLVGSMRNAGARK
jgi:F0F1-type ATP synthase membrane subunit c/vacuolar-type H+-ATPase subunit K